MRYIYIYVNTYLVFMIFTYIYTRLAASTECSEMKPDFQPVQ